MTESAILSLFRQTNLRLDGHLVVEAFEPGKLPPDHAAIPATQPGNK